jgi:hypothetical protein
MKVLSEMNSLTDEHDEFAKNAGSPEDFRCWYPIRSTLEKSPFKISGTRSCGIYNVGSSLLDETSY